MTPTFLRASVDGDLREAEEQIQASLPTDWPSIRDVLSRRLQQLESDPALQPWLLRAMSLRESRTMIGHIGFHTAPGAEYLRPWSPGAVEFGFTVFPDYRRQGYATEASRALMQWARHVHGVTKFVLTIDPNNVPSQTLAASLGFERIGSHVDEVDGIEDVLALELSI
jgi:ribosomal-protein-alanine N-acetyltransferase